MTFWIFTPSVYLSIPLNIYIQERNDDLVVKASKNLIKNSTVPVIMGIINGISKRNNKDTVEISIVNPFSTIKIQLYIHHEIEIGDLIVIRNAKLLVKSEKYTLDQESSIEIGHRFLKDEIINDKITDLNLKVVVEDLIKWGSTQEWIHKLVEATQPDQSTIKNIKVNASFVQLFIINAMNEKIDITVIKSLEDFINYLCNIRCDTCRKCNFRQDANCVYCKSVLDKSKRADLSDLRMEVNTIQGFLELRLWKWCDQWFPEIMQYPQGEIESVYKRFMRVLDKIKELTQVSMVIQQVAKVFYLIDVD